MASDAQSRGVVWAFAIGLGVLAIATCGGVAVVGAAAAGLLVLSAPSTPVQVGGPISIRATATPAVETPASPIHAEGLFVLAGAKVTSDPAPARFSAPLPSTVDDFHEMVDGAARFPPYSYVTELACSADPAMSAQILASIRGLVKEGATAQDLLDTWDPVYRYCEPMPCDFLRSVVTGSESDAVKAPFWSALVMCRDDATAKVFERTDAPDRPWLARLTVEPPQPWSKRLESAASRQIRDGEPWEARAAALVLGATDDARNAKALLALHAAETDPEKKRILAIAMYRQSEPTAKALFERTCAERTDPEAVCGQTDAQRAGPPHRETLLATKKIDDLLIDYSIEMRDVVEANETSRKADLVDALERCATSYSEWRGRRCLSALAVIDWKKASAIATKMSLPEDPGAVELRQALRLFDDRQTLLARLRSDGVLRTGDTIDPRATDVRDLLVAAGRAYDFDVETGMYPNEHDSLLRRLARLARPELDGILFLETPPPLDDESGETDGSNYRVDAWLGGKRWTVEMEDLGDWHDLERCLGLLNTILTDRGSSVRYASLATGDQMAFVVAGDGGGITRLDRDRLLGAADPGLSEDAGKAFEQQALDALRRGGDAGR